MRKQKNTIIDVRRGLAANAPDYIRNHKILDYPLEIQERRGRELVADDVNESSGSRDIITQDNVVLAKRCSAVFHIVIRYLDHILKPDMGGRVIKNLQIAPAYCLFNDATKAVGWQDIYTEDFTNSEFKTDTARLKEIRKKLAPVPRDNDIRLLIINSPNNPTGEVYSQHFLRGILKIMRENPDLYVLSDVIYEKMTEAPTIFRLADTVLRERIFEVTGISKTVMPGDRNSVGYVYTGGKNALEITKLLERGVISKEESHVLDKHRVSCLIAALDREITTQDYFDANHHYYDMRKIELTNEFSRKFAEQGVKMEPAGDLYYIILNFKKSGLDSEEIVKEMHDRYGIALLEPNKVGFGHTSLRFSLGTAILDNSLKETYADDKRNDDFYEIYKDKFFSSDIGVYRYILEKIHELVIDLKKEKSQIGHADAILAERGRDVEHSGSGHLLSFAI